MPGCDLTPAARQHPECAPEMKTHAENRVRVLMDQLDTELARHGSPQLPGYH